MEKSSRLVTRASSDITNQINNFRANAELQRLEKKFNEFHKNHPAQTKIPDHLRHAVLAAIENGTPVQEIRKACVITSNQIRQWQKSKATAIKTNKLQNPRILEIQDDNQIQKIKPDEIAPAQIHPMEIRLGGWSISINQIGQ